METWQLIVSVCAGVITITTLAEKVWKYTRPVATADKNLKDILGDIPILKASVKDIGRRVDKLEIHQDNDLRALKDHANANKVVCSALLALLDHELSGNHTEQLEDAKGKIQSYLIER